MEQQTILIVDDDREIVRVIAKILELEGYRTLKAYDGLEALDMLVGNVVHLIMIDIMMPKMNGLAAVMKIRETNNIPIIILSAKTEETDKVLGLSMGADDYIIKPFRPRELTARIRTALRKYGGSPSAFEMCDLHVDTASGVVKKSGREVFLSALEYRLLLIFINNPNVIITRDRLLDELWDAAGEFVNNNTLTVYIKRLREKIEDDPGNPQIILTVRGTGYRLGGSYVSE